MGEGSGVGDKRVSGGAAGQGAEELRGGAVFDNDDQASVTSPGKNAGDGAERAVASLAQALRGQGGDQAGGPVHGVDEAAQDGEPAGAFIGAPVLGVDEVVDDAQGLGLVGEDAPSGVDEVAPAGVWLVGAGGKAGGGAAPAVGPRPRCGAV
ncbi:MAG: hypothetical protein ACRDRA_20105 [Pseudonocardiaceae bacterium]